jgi:probable HAF family extracellular repeat protein
VIVGYGFDSSNSSQAFRWTEADGMVELGPSLGYISSYAFAVSADGSVVVGGCSTSSDQTPFVWTEGLRMHRLGEFLGDAVPEGWKLEYASDVVRNGNVVTVVGRCMDPCSCEEAFIASFTIPEPSSLMALSTVLVGLGVVLRRSSRF